MKTLSQNSIVQGSSWQMECLSVSIFKALRRPKNLIKPKFFFRYILAASNFPHFVYLYEWSTWMSMGFKKTEFNMIYCLGSPRYKVDGCVSKLTTTKHTIGKLIDWKPTRETSCFMLVEKIVPSGFATFMSPGISRSLKKRWTNGGQKQVISIHKKVLGNV